MEQQQSEVVLFGNWASGFCHRVELALKLKGIPYKYVEEDLANKSELLLGYNPVHKKVPVLVHNGKAIAESVIILQYIDECWDNSPKLLPEDPYQRSKIRFWVDFYDQMLSSSSFIIMKSKGEEREKALENFKELFEVFEEGIEKDFPARSPFINGQTLGFLDIVAAASSCNYRAFEEAAAVDLNIHKHPKFLSWVTALQGVALVKETIPAHDKLVVAIGKKFPPPPNV